MDLHITQQVLLAGLIIAVVMGAVVNKTNFCTMGAVSDMVNMGDKSRLRAWFLAIAVAIVGVIILEYAGMVDTSSMRPPYRTAMFDWLRYILGGVLFGIGMTLGSGCGNKTLVRIGGGNIKSVFVLVIAAFFAYLMTKTDFYGVLFYSWMNPITIDLAKLGVQGQDLGSVFAATGMADAVTMRLILGGLIAVGLLVYVFKSEDFRKGLDNIVGGLVVGLCVVAAWYVTSGPMGQEWIGETEMMDEIPLGVGSQSFSFTNPMGETFDLALSGGNKLLITFGVAGLFGVILGSFLYAIIFRKFRIEWFTGLKDFAAHAVGGTLMGIGGILSMGCTIGQGVTGFSTLAIGSMMAFVSFIFGSALTMKIQYYKLVYEADASYAAAFITALVDMKLLPSGMRKLEAV
ncbi:MAG: YeeE/YedE family protein [Gammaproteobacteria bacterium]|nr:YeeE/YedE family protein [Gammaproteobacteria bacterium]MDH5800569.1 YeeE/YedE family protein [Gammaproteobacteria bacterium]